MEIEEFLTYWRVIKKRLWLILVLVVATMAVILATSLTAKPVYRATVKLQVIGSEPQQVSLFNTVRAASVGDEVSAIENEFASVLRNGLVAWRTIADLKLSVEAVELLNRISESRDGDSMYVTADADTPQEAEAIVNKHVEKALAYYRDYRALPAQVTRQFISQQVQAQEQALFEAQDALLKFKLQNNVDSLDRELAAFQDNIRTLKTQRDTAGVEEARSRAQAGAYTQQAAGAKSDLDKQSPEATASQAYYKEAMQYFTRQAAEQNANAEAQKIAKDQYDQLSVQKEAELLALIGLSEKYTKLQRAVDLATTNYNFLLSKENEAKLKEANALGVGYIQIVEPARPPDAPAQSNLPKLAALGAVASLLVGIILAFVIEFFEGLGRVVTAKKPAPTQEVPAR